MKLSTLKEGFIAFSTYALLFGLPETFGRRAAYFVGWMMGTMICVAVWNFVASERK
jgi:hypothetical protein